MTPSVRIKKNDCSDESHAIKDGMFADGSVIVVSVFLRIAADGGQKRWFQDF